MLLETISDKERRVEELKDEKELLERNQEELKQQTDEIIESVNHNSENLGPLQKEIDTVEESLQKIK